MAATQGKIGYGTLLKRGDAASPQVFTTIAEVRSISGFGSKANLVDMTNLDSLNSAMEYIAAMKDGVQMSIECNFIPTNVTQNLSAGMIADHISGVVRDFQMHLPGTFGVFSFSGIVLEWNVPKLAPQDPLTVTFGVKITGPISYT